MSNVKTIHFATNGETGFVRIEDADGNVWLAEADGVVSKAEVLDDFENGEFDYLLGVVDPDQLHHVEGWPEEHPGAELIYEA